MSVSSENINQGNAYEEQRAANDYKIWQVIGASAAGTMIEWYDFFVFGSLAATISGLFYPASETAAGATWAFIAYLSTFAVGFIVRPFGGAFFGRLGDTVGRKYTFLVTLLIMGGATAAIGLLPTFATIGYAAPVLLLVIRILQGLALGGEYGGAAIYVAEHVPDSRRGFYTSFIQVTAALGLLISLAVILSVQNLMSADDFKSYGWRIPFLLSLVLVGMSLYIRLQMKESPIFQKLKDDGKTTRKPLTESLGSAKNWRLMALCLFGVTAVQGVIFYTAHFYSLFYLQKILAVDTKLANYIVGAALVLGLPFYVFFGWLSDKIGRKWLMVAGALLSIASFYPIYQGMQAAANSNVVKLGSADNKTTGEPSLIPYTQINNREAKISIINGIATPVVVLKELKDGKEITVDKPAAVVNGQLVPLVKDAATGGLTINSQPVVNNALPDGTLVTIPVVQAPNFWALVFLVFAQIFIAAMFYGPQAAFLVEFFPARIRYTLLSIPYNIGTGVFGGLLPLIGSFICASTGNLYAGLLFPIIVAAIGLIVDLLFLPETRHHRIWDEFETESGQNQTI